MFLDGPSVGEQGQGLFWPSSIPVSILPGPCVWPVLSSPICSEQPWLCWLRVFQVLQGLVAFPWCVFMAHGHSFPQVWCQGEVMAAAWQEGGEWGKCFVLLGGPRARSCSQTQIWRPGGGHCVLFLVCEPGTAQIPEGTSFGVQRTGRQFLHGCFPFHPPVPSLTCAPVSVPAVTILVLEHESPFFTNCCNVRPLTNSV